jgi:Cu+-exporting ATPase
MAKDLVCGMDVPEDTPHRAEHHGKTYYFCCETCKVNFLKDPDEYTKNQPG